MIDSTLILGYVQDFNSGTANLFVFVANQGDDRVDNFRAADFGESIAAAMQVRSKEGWSGGWDV